jgi:hypothetical protein
MASSPTRFQNVLNDAASNIWQALDTGPPRCGARSGGSGGGGGGLGRAVQVDPLKPALKAPRSERLKPEHQELLSIFAFKSNLRRYTWELEQQREQLNAMVRRCALNPKP